MESIVGGGGGRREKRRKSLSRKKRPKIETRGSQVEPIAWKG